MSINIRRYAGRLIDYFCAFLPQRYRLRLQYWKFVVLLEWEPEIRHIKEYVNEGQLAIDVGANIGLWTYALAKTGLFKQIIAFEPNSALTSDLQNASINGVVIIHKAISNVSGESVLRIPKKGGVLG